MTIKGRVDTQQQAWIQVEIRDRNGEFQPIETVVDTGFTGFMTLPLEIIDQLGLERRLRTTVTLATGRRERVNTWRGYLLWHEQLCPILVLQSRGTPLLGMELLEGSLLTIQARANRDVLIEVLGDRT